MPYWRECQEILDKLEQLENGTERMELIEKIKTLSDDQGISFMLNAAVKDDVVLINRLIKLGFDVNARNQKGMVPLDCAIIYGNLEAADALVKAGANFEHSVLTTKFGSPLHYAAEKKSVELIKWLMNRLSIPGVGDINAKDSEGQTPLSYAIIQSRTEAVRILIEAGCDLTITDSDGHTPLICALISVSRIFRAGSSKNYEIVKMLIEAGSHVNHRSIYGWTVLHFAAVSDKDFMIIPLLLEKEADVNATNFDGLLALHLAIATNNYSAVKGLIDAGSRLDWQNEEKKNILHFAMHCCEPKIVKLLLEKGVSIHAINDRDVDPFSYGVLCFGDWTSVSVDFKNWFKGKLKCLKVLLKHGADINRVSSQEGTPLTIAIRYNVINNRVIPFLLNNKAVVDFNNEYVQETINSSKKASRFLIKHAALCLMQSHRNEQIKNFDFDKLPEELKKYYCTCQDELYEMKKCEIVENEFTFFHVLVANKITHYVRNERTVEMLKKISNLKLFPIYIKNVRRRIEKELKKQKLLDNAKNGLSQLIKWDLNSFSVVYDNILRFLPKPDLYTLSSI